MRLHFGLLLLSATIAMVLWGMAHGTSDIERSLDIPVIFQGVPENVVVKYKGRTTQSEVTLQRQQDHEYTGGITELKESAAYDVRAHCSWARRARRNASSTSCGVDCGIIASGWPLNGQYVGTVSPLVASTRASSGRT